MERGEDPTGGASLAAVVDADDGTIVAAPDGLFVPAWVDADSLMGIGVSAAGSLEFARVDLDEERSLSGLVFDGAVVERVGMIADLGVDPGKDRMLIRYRDGTNNSLTRLDTASFQYGPTIPVDGLVSWAISRTGDRIVAGTSSGVVVFDARSGEEIGVLPDRELRTVVVTATDQLFVGSLGGELTQYDLMTLEPVLAFGGSRGHVAGGSGTADGSLIAIHGNDRIAAIYDVATGVQIGGPITIAADERNIARLSPDGRWLAVGGQPNVNDGIQPGDTVDQRATQIWDLDPAHWMSAACRVAGRNLTRGGVDGPRGNTRPLSLDVPGPFRRRLSRYLPVG